MDLSSDEGEPGLKPGRSEPPGERGRATRTERAVANGWRRAFGVVGRAFGWGALGGVCGLLLGLTVGIIHAPRAVAGDELANEWYTVGVMMFILLECVAGFLAGAGIAVALRTRSGRRKAFAFALGGAVLGVGLGWVLARVFHVILVDWRDGSEHMSSLLLQGVGGVGGMLFVVSRESPPGRV
jgi:hypothetical protein